MIPPFRFNQPVIVSPPGAAPYPARYVSAAALGMVKVHASHGPELVPANIVTPLVLGLGDAVAARHGAGGAP